MQAIIIRRPGGPEVLELADLPVPRPGEGQVLVRAKSIGVGKPDVLFRTGVYRWMPPLPAVVGSELTGTVEALGAGVTGLSIGQRVLVTFPAGGCYAGFVVAPLRTLTPLPDDIDFDDATCIPNYVTAWALLFEAARGIEVRTLFINGAAGGIGNAVIDLAKVYGLTVIGGVSSDEKCAFIRQRGASHAINYSRQNVVEEVLKITAGTGVDLILDHVIGKNFTDSLDMLAQMGTIVSFNALGGFPEKELFSQMRAHLPKCPAVRCFTAHYYDSHPEKLARIKAEMVGLLADRKVKPAIHATLPLPQARRAHEMLDGREVLGKLILRPGPA
ncbi:MAG: quinone oxidoreductase family protein [Xanthobacteraceae bacterium]